MRDPLATDILAEDDEVDRIFDWLGFPDSSIKINNLLCHRARSTGSWFLDGEAFTKLKAGTTRVLWLHGKGASLANAEMLVLTLIHSGIGEEYHDVRDPTNALSGEVLTPYSAQQQTAISRPSAPPPDVALPCATSLMRRTTPSPGT